MTTPTRLVDYKSIVGWGSPKVTTRTQGFDTTKGLVGLGLGMMMERKKEKKDN